MSLYTTQRNSHIWYIWTLLNSQKCRCWYKTIIKVTNIFNARFYGLDIRASAILFGDLPPPAHAEDLYKILNSFTEKYEIEEPKHPSKKGPREPKKVCIHLFFILGLSVTETFHFTIEPKVYTRMSFAVSANSVNYIDCWLAQRLFLCVRLSLFGTVVLSLLTLLAGGVV